MAYKIAVASTDGENIDTSFGAACVFDIYEAEGAAYYLLEKREYQLPANAAPVKTDSAANKNSCGTGAGCGGAEGAFPKVQFLSDCRCVICKKIGFPIQKQLEKRAIISFDVDCTVEEALTKVTAYFEKTDNHQSLRGIQNTEGGAI